MKRELWVGATLCTLVQPAWAQSDVPTARTDISVSAAGTYEDNVQRTNKAFPSPFLPSRSDYKFTPSVVVDVTRPIGRQSVFLTGSAGYDFYKRNKRLERERIALTGGADLQFAGCTQRVALGIARSQSDLNDFVSIAPVDTRNAQTRATASLATRCGDMLGLTPGFTYDFEKTTNSAAIREISNFNSHQVGASLGYSNPTIGEVSLYASYRRGSYPKRIPLFGSQLGEKIDVYTGGVRLTREIGTRLRGSVNLGFTKVNPANPLTPSFKGASYGADLTWTGSDTIQTKLAIGRAVNQSSLLDVSYSIDDSYSLTNNIAVGQAVKLRLGGSIVKRRFRDSPTFGANPLGGDDRLRQLFGGITYRPPGRVTFGFDVTGATRRSQIARYDYSYASATLSARFRI